LPITRLANVTGLDTLGILVVMSVRPNSRSLSVSQGKGSIPATQQWRRLERSRHRVSSMPSLEYH
jgi:ribosomal protein S12 methylthiotransferase accessory factor YcaO